MQTELILNFQEDLSMSGLFPIVEAANTLYQDHEGSSWNLFSKKEKLASLVKKYADKSNQEKYLTKLPRMQPSQVI